MVAEEGAVTVPTNPAAPLTTGSDLSRDSGSSLTPPPPGPALRTSAIVFSYDEEAALRRCLPALLESSVEEIVVVYGGADGSRAYLESLHDPRLHLDFEAVRAGKWRAFNRAIERVGGEVVFLVSGDITFSPAVFDHLLSQFSPDIGVVFPRVIPANVRGVVGRMGRVLWDVHDIQIVVFGQSGLTVHGGELQAVRRSLLEPISGVINEDAYLCLRAAERGYRVVYDRDTVVRNTVPETLTDFLAQRTRVNYGHRQLADSGMAPSTIDRLFWSRPRMCLRVLSRAIFRRPANSVRLPLLASLELLALVRGRRDFDRGVEYGRWPLIRSGKGGSFASAPGKATSFPWEK
ncbi:MAG: glycosyltransferase family 2 protein [Thermoplasmata archaeon]|nr:glycosyltransferase family 2 protein [Thermoplasmata archaeon]